MELGCIEFCGWSLDDLIAELQHLNLRLARVKSRHCCDESTAELWDYRKRVVDEIVMSL